MSQFFYRQKLCKASWLLLSCAKPLDKVFRSTKGMIYFFGVACTVAPKFLGHAKSLQQCFGSVKSWLICTVLAYIWPGKVAAYLFGSRNVTTKFLVSLSGRIGRVSLILHRDTCNLNLEPRPGSYSASLEMFT